MTPEQIEDITHLRALNLSSKQIARKLGLRPSEVSAFLRREAVSSDLATTDSDGLPPLQACFVDEPTAQTLLDYSKKTWEEDPNEVGLSQVFVVRIQRNQYSIASFLVDCWCLGVKDAFGPRKLDRRKYQALLKGAYEGFGGAYRDISLKEAQSIIFGATDYADQLGLKPHSDFKRARIQLGQRMDDLIPLQFGRDGRPFYSSGPYDNVEKILSTLERHVGKGNFGALVHMGEFF